MERNPFLPGHYPFYRLGYNPISGSQVLMADALLRKVQMLQVR